jgi:hypothetical protein
VTLLVVGNRETPRGRRLAEALQQSALAWRWASWDDAIADPAALAARVNPGDLVRLESPGQRPEVERALHLAGADAPLPPRAERLDAAALRALPAERGRLLAPAQWFAGFRRALGALDAAVRARGGRFANAPADVDAMFDKPATHARLAAAGVATTEGLGAVDTWDELLDRMRARGLDRAFVKLAAASSSAGAVALSLRTGAPRVLTTIELARSPHATRRYNSRRVRLALGDEARELTAWVLDQGAQVERWHPKARVAGGEFDLRVVCIGGAARHHVARVSRTPMTNLHLGNRRLQPDELAAAIPARALGAALALAARAARAFPDSACCGVDVLLDPALASPRVIEVNAFGDLLPGTLDGGVETHAAELALLAGPP